MLRTVATSSASGTESCASACFCKCSSRPFSSLASSAPTIRSLMVTSPLAFSSEPWMTTHGALRRSAYLICLPRFARIGRDKVRREYLRHATSPPCSGSRQGDPVEDGDDDRARLGLVVELAEILQHRGEPRHADGDAGCRHRLAAKARDQSVVTSAAGRRTELRRAVGAVGRKVQSNFEDRPGVVFETADDGRVDALCGWYRSRLSPQVGTISSL